MTVARIETPEQFDEARALFREYAVELSVDLSFQGFDAELAALERVYGPPGGAVLLAADETASGDVAGSTAGCVAVRPAPAAGTGACEMKRLYVRPGYRGRGLGRRLAEAVVDEGRRLGYRRMVLDTLDEMEQARAVYGSLGFREVPAYYANPLGGVHYMAADL